MKPIFKYPGGKSREIKNILPFITAAGEIKRIVEPFSGSAALSFFLEKPSLMSDVNDDAINLYKVVQSESLFPLLLELIKKSNVVENNVKHLEKIYYAYRDGEFGNNDPLIKAYRFILLRQLCFSGMYRINKKTGRFNVPFGWYKKLTCNLTHSHHFLLQQWEVNLVDFAQTISECKNGDFLFLDPPYFERNSGYHTDSDAGTSEDLHIRLNKQLKSINQPWLIIHSDCELYRDVYKDYIIEEFAFTYTQNFKGRAIKDSAVKHLYISNFNKPESIISFK
jgi:DNA adenine methylase